MPDAELVAGLDRERLLELARQCDSGKFGWAIRPHELAQLAALCRVVAKGERALCEAMATVTISGGQNGPVVERQPDDDSGSTFTVYPTLASALGAVAEGTSNA